MCFGLESSFSGKEKKDFPKKKKKIFSEKKKKIFPEQRKVCTCEVCVKYVLKKNSKKIERLFIECFTTLIKRDVDVFWFGTIKVPGASTH